jgi:hypothetical protein
LGVVGGLRSFWRLGGQGWIRGSRFDMVDEDLGYTHTENTLFHITQHIIKHVDKLSLCFARTSPCN